MFHLRLSSLFLFSFSSSSFPFIENPQGSSLAVFSKFLKKVKSLISPKAFCNIQNLRFTLVLPLNFPFKSSDETNESSIFSFPLLYVSRVNSIFFLLLAYHWPFRLSRHIIDTCIDARSSEFWFRVEKGWSKRAIELKSTIENERDSQNYFLLSGRSTRWCESPIGFLSE